ncbi:DNA-binding protein [Salmonella enterica]|nr:DNA-binding protein [Salmonella enterica]
MSKLPSLDMVRRIEDAAAALIATGTPNPTKAQVRDHLGGGSLATISVLCSGVPDRLGWRRRSWR